MNYVEKVTLSVEKEGINEICQSWSKRSKNSTDILILPSDYPLRTRKLLTSYVDYNKVTGLWIATINTDQKGGGSRAKPKSSHLKAFSFSSEQEAKEAGYIYAPPKLIPFEI